MKHTEPIEIPLPDGRVVLCTKEKLCCSDCGEVKSHLNTIIRSNTKKKWYFSSYCKPCSLKRTMARQRLVSPEKILKDTIEKHLKEMTPANITRKKALIRKNIGKLFKSVWGVKLRGYKYQPEDN